MGMLVGTCHCGAVKVSVPRRPRRVTNCNCSSCRRLGALWAYYRVDDVRVEAAPDATQAYIWGDKTLRTVRCRTCGCTTHWVPMQKQAASKIGVNARLFEPEQLGNPRIRLFDGAVSWRYVD
jgi:hypothetical protein